MIRLAAIVLALAGFANARLPWTFVFPRDHGAHDAFRTEWWYLTGHLRAPGGRRFGYELTLFRVAVAPGSIATGPGRSRWRALQVYPAHLALTDERGHRFRYDERFARGALGIGRAASGRLDVAVDGWTLRGAGPLRMQAATDGFALALEQTPEKPPAVHGRRGISLKGPCASCASHYYSYTRLRTRGTLVVGETRYAVRGRSWMDHEFGSDQLAPGMSGWDWFSVQLDDGRDLMDYRLRRSDGGVVPESSGSLVDRGGRVRHLALGDVAVAATGSWHSPHTGARYPSGWRLRVPSAALDLTLVPVLADQELADTAGGVSYWEGDVDVYDAAGRRCGAGYVELTGYAGTVRL